MAPVDAKLELVVQGDAVNPRFDVHLPVDALVHAAKILLDFLECRRPVADLNQAGGHIHREGILALFSQKDFEFVLKFNPERDVVLALDGHRRVAVA